MILFGRFLTGISCVLGVVLGVGSDEGQAVPSPSFISSKKLDDSQPILFYADDIQYNRKLGIWFAKGNVEFALEDRVLEADIVIYHEKTNLLIARGNVRLREKSGEVLTASYMELTGDLKEGVLHDVKLLMVDQSRLAAHRAKRINGGKNTVFEQGVYSPCYPCEQDAQASPLWQLKAREVTENSDSGTITALDTHLEFKGVPVFYSPWFRFSTRRASGFLAPTGVASSILGTSIGIPYYWVIDDRSDLTLTPFATVKRGGLLGGEYRYQGNTSFFTVTGSANQSSSYSLKDSAGKVEGEAPAFRGHIFATYKQDINSKWRLELDGKRVSDKTYFRTFRELPLFGNVWDWPYLESYATAERFSSHDYLRVKGISYQGLRETDFTAFTPYIAPMISYEMVSRPLWKGSYVTLDTTFTSLYRQQGSEYQRGTFQGSWNFPYISNWGQVFQTFGSVRGDLYCSRVASNPMQPLVLSRQTKARFFPQGGLETRWPLEAGLFVIEPTLQLITAPYKGTSTEIPDLDCEGFQFNDITLSSGRRDRFPGYDRLDVGSRATYGVTVVSHSRGVLKNTRFFLGQTYSFTNPPQDLNSFGLYRGASDVVGTLQMDPHPWVSIDYRFRLARTRLRPKFNEVFASVGPEELRVGAAYIQYKPDNLNLTLLEKNPKIQQLEWSLSSRLSRTWTMGLSQLRSLMAPSGLLSQGAYTTYQNECFYMRVFFGRSYFRAPGVQPTTTFLVTFALKNLGKGYENKADYRASNLSVPRTRQFFSLPYGEGTPSL